MKKLSLLAAVFLCGSFLFAESPAKNKPAEPEPFYKWNLFWSGSWEENRTLHNRGEIKINFLPPGLALRGEILDRHTMNFELNPPWGDPAKGVTNITGGLYHKSTGSRLLYGVLDEWGLSARIRNPWIRSAPYAENHQPLMADIKTVASGTKEDEAYLYLSSPFLNFFRDVKLRGFVSTQTSIENFTPTFSGGIDAVLTKNTGLLLEAFYTGAALPASKRSTWFSDPPPLPERDFGLYAAGILFNNQLVSVSSDWAWSETFAWGTGIYGNFGVCFTPSLPFGNRARPLSVSFAVDGAGGKFIYRDGVDHGMGFRGAGKIEWKGSGNSLLRVNTLLRGPGLEEDFNRSSSGIYFRFPAKTAKNSQNFNFPVRLTRISLSVDRNAVNTQKINDGLSGFIGIAVKNYPVGVNFSGTIKGLTSSAGSPSPYPIPEESWVFDTGGASCELLWSPYIFQFKTKLGFTAYEKKDNIWDISFSAAARFKYGRLSLKAESHDFPEKWNFTVSWRLEKK
jgi:hypothetical protein